MSDWYFLRDGGQFGPLSWQDLWGHGQKGELRPADLVWTEGMPEWRTAGSIPGLFPASQPQPVQQPVQPQPAPAPQRTYAPAPQAAPAPAPQASPYHQPYQHQQPYQPPYQPQSAPAPYAQAVPQAVPQKPIGDDPLMRMVLPVGRSAWAIAAGYLGLLSFLVVFAPLALAAGLFAVVDIKQNPHKHGMGRAIFGIIMGVIGSLFLVFFVIALTMEK
ncbi:MAG TPA: GYF domain-containing protein [Thermoanaerobaculia bacterium]